MQTTCNITDNLCDLTRDSTHYNCSPVFSGNLSIEPIDGRYRIPGWNTTFYKIENGVSKEINTIEDQNPFLFNVTVQTDSISDLLDFTNLPAPLVSTGGGNVAFALSCIGTVYNVTYSLVNGSIDKFDPQPAPPRLASIVRAPLQVGYGRYNLYQAAILAVANSLNEGSEPINSTMARSFSQVGIALSSGAFIYTTNIAQRSHYDIDATSVPKNSVWFLASICALYAIVSIVLFVFALMLRNQDGVPEAHLKLWRVNEKDSDSSGADDTDDPGDSAIDN